MPEDLYTVGLALDTAPLQQGLQQATRGLQTLGQAEDATKRKTTELEQAEKRLAEAQTLLAKTTEVITQETQRAGQAKDSLRTKTQQATTTQKAFQSGLQGLLGPFTSVQGAAGALGAYLGGQLVRSIVQASSQMQTLQLSLNAVTGSTKAGAEAMLFARQTANQLGLASNDVAAIYRGFLANTNGLNLGVTTTQKLFTGLVATTKLVGGGSETLSNAVRGLTQTFALGKLDAGNWKEQVEEALPVLASALPKALGLTRAAFMEQMAAGQLTMDRVLTPLITVLSQNLPKAAEIAATSMEGSAARIGNSWRDIQASFEGSALARWVENIVTGFHDLGAEIGAINPRPLSAIEQIQARITVLTNGVNMSRKVSISDQKELNELQASMVRLKELEARHTAFRAGEEAKRRTAAAVSPGGVTKTLTTQMQQEVTQAQRRYAVGQQVGLEPLDLQRAKLSDLNKALGEHIDVLATNTTMSAADRQARLDHAAAIQTEIERLEASITAQKDAEQARKESERQRKADAKERERDAERAAQRQQQFIEEQNAAYDRATMSEAQLLEQRGTRLGVPEAKREELEYQRQQTEAAEEQNRRIAERDGLYKQLDTDLRVIQHAMDNQLSLERAREEITLSLITANKADLAQLLAMNDARREGLALLERRSRFEESIGGGARLGFEALPERTDTAQEHFKVLEDASQQFASTFLDEINRVTEEGAFSFTRFADSVIQDLLRILQQQFLMPWLEKGIQAGLQILSGLGGVGSTASTVTPFLQSIGGTAGLGMSQTGGPLRRGLTLVGEAGPEAIATRGGRSMVFPTSHPVTRAALRSAGVPRRQYGGPLPSAVMGGTGSEAVMSTMGSGQGGGGQGGAVVQNFYIQSPDAASFVRSKGEIQRQMQAAFRASQRS